MLHIGAKAPQIRMPDNSATLFGRNPNDQLWKLEKYIPRLELITADIKNRRHGSHFGTPGLIGWLCGLPSVERKLLGGFKPTVNPDRCIGCGLCSRVCPIGNIVVDGRATIGACCSACLGCLHACPQQAITTGKPVQKERQYRHPDIQLQDLA